MPFPYKIILCAIDFDECSIEALKEASALAVASSGVLQVLHVVKINPLVDMGAGEGNAAPELYEEQIKFARKRVEQMMSAIPAEASRQIKIEIGEPGDVIVDVLAKVGANLVVIGTHGRKGLRHLLLGSIAERVVRESNIPVLAVRPHLNGES